MVILVCGSRDWVDYKHIRDVLNHYPDTTTIVHGGARGADQLAGQAAKELGMDVIVVPARWDLYGRSAGYKRNKAMVDMGPDRVIAFSNGSRGTQHTIDLARQAGLDVSVYGKEYVEYDDGF